MPRPKKALKLNFSKCSRCRHDRQKCEPRERTWPDRCQRCIKYNYSCSENQTKKRSNRFSDRHVRQLKQKDWIVEAGRFTLGSTQNSIIMTKQAAIKASQEHLEDLNYLARLRRHISDEHSDSWYQSIHPRCGRAYVISLNSALFKATEHALSYCDALEPGDRIKSILYEKIASLRGLAPPTFPSVEFICTRSRPEERIRHLAILADLPAAEEYLENYLLSADRQSTLANSELCAALLRLYDITSGKLDKVAHRWQLDPAVSLAVLSFSLRWVPAAKAWQGRQTLFSRLLAIFRDWSRPLDDALYYMVARYDVTCVATYRSASCPQHLMENMLDIAARNGQWYGFHAINKIFYTEENAVMYAAKREWRAATKLLLDREFSHPGLGDKGLLISIAASEGYEIAVAALLESGASVNQCDLSQQWASYHMVEEKRKFILEALHIRDSPFGLETDHKYTPLHLASHSGHENIVKLLLDHQASLDLQNSDGDTPLHLAARMGHTRIIEILAENGAKCRIQNKRELVPWEAAFLGSHWQTAEKLASIDHWILRLS